MSSHQLYRQHLCVSVLSVTSASSSSTELKSTCIFWTAALSRSKYSVVNMKCKRKTETLRMELSLRCSCVAVLLPVYCLLIGITGASSSSLADIVLVDQTLTLSTQHSLTLATRWRKNVNYMTICASSGFHPLISLPLSDSQHPWEQSEHVMTHTFRPDIEWSRSVGRIFKILHEKHF